MIVYVDIVFLINLIMDFYILSGVKFLLRLDTKLIRIILGSIFGSISTLFLFLKLNIVELNIIKIIISLFMVLISFGKYKFFNRLFYMYIVSIILGGSIYLINDSLGYEVFGFIFVNNEYSINLIILVFISPIIIYLYVREFLKLKKRLNTMYSVIIKFKNKEIRVEGFLDTGNKLVDPYFHRPIVLVRKSLISLKNRKIFYVPFYSLNNNGLLKCISCEYILINDKRYDDILIGISENLNIDCVLNERLFDI